MHFLSDEEIKQKLDDIEEKLKEIETEKTEEREKIELDVNEAYESRIKELESLIRDESDKRLLKKYTKELKWVHKKQKKEKKARMSNFMMEKKRLLKSLLTDKKALMFELYKRK